MSGSVGQVREQLGRIEAKIDSLADDVHWLVRVRGDDDPGKVEELLAVVGGLRKQIEELHEPVQHFASYRRRMIAIGAGALSFGGFLWAFAQPIYVELISHVRFQW